MQEQEAAAAEECVSDEDMLEIGGDADTAQVDDNVNFDADVDADSDVDDRPDSSSSSTQSAAGQDDMDVSDEAAVKRDRRMRRIQRELECNLGGYWKKPKLPRGLDCNLGGYWTKPILRRKTNRA